mmetsp:Transcript_4101/g.9883  ORF Transcript_4101/g.9883 Transcript_4101/m.9883 type:complete len:311 (-) Transcript_4101:67-999(-)
MHSVLTIVWSTMTRKDCSGFVLLLCCVFIAPNNAWEMKSVTTTSKLPTTNLPRRSFLALAPVLTSAAAQALDPGIPSGDNNKLSLEQQQNDAERPFVSAAFPRKELTNSIVASRDTNISPAEVYETILRLKKESSDGSASGSTGAPPRALDVGAGAGVSTQVIYEQLGYTNIDALDWSGEAWRINVVEGGYCPPTVHFYELDDERFVEQWKKENLGKYDVIAFNFAVNREKAQYFCKNLLKPDGLLLAPVNAQQDYWLKQTYQLLNANGEVAWSAADVGAWSVQFQPDVTQDTCQGIWCSPFNGFQKLRR